MVALGKVFLEAFCPWEGPSEIILPALGKALLEKFSQVLGKPSPEERVIEALGKHFLGKLSEALGKGFLRGNLEDPLGRTFGVSGNFE